MRRLMMLALVGGVAQLVDGSMGMGYGLTSGTMLLSIGLAPVAASASVHLAELATNLAATASHWRLGNVEWRVVVRLAGPGMAGAFVGAVVLAGLSGALATVVMAAVLVVLGGQVLLRTVRGRRPRRHGLPGARLLVPLGLVAGFVDATGSGGWGPVATPALLGDGRIAPRRVIGSVDAAEFAVSLAATLGFLIALGPAVVHGRLVLALLAGGVVAAPVAAGMVRVMPAPVLGVLAGGMVVATNLRTLLLAAGADAAVRFSVYVLVAAVVLVLLAAVIDRHRRRPPEPVAGSRVTATAAGG